MVDDVQQKSNASQMSTSDYNDEREINLTLVTAGFIGALERVPLMLKLLYLALVSIIGCVILSVFILYFASLNRNVSHSSGFCD